MDPVLTGALSELIAGAVARAAGWSWSSMRGEPGARAMHRVIDATLSSALANSALPVGRLADQAWVSEVARVWRPAFTPGVSAAMVDCLADPSSEAAGRFAGVARTALRPELGHLL